MPAASSGRLRTLVATPGDGTADAIAAAWAAGDAVLPLDPAAPGPVRAAVTRALRPDLPVDPEVALVVATSGSTGAPKGVQLSHDALAASVAAAERRIGVAAGDRWLSCLPWHHIAGLQVLLRARRAGLPLVVHERFDVERFGAERDVTLVSLVPTQLARLLDAGVRLDRFRVVLLGGAAASPALLERARAAGAPVVTTYGMSETCGGCVYDGRPLDGVDVRIGADGRIELRGPMLMSGYRRQPAQTAEVLVDGWLRTGDLGRWDGERLTVLGRADDVIVSGGENVVPGEVERVLAAHPSVGDAVVVGVPDAEWGQRVVAAVVPTGDPVDAGRLRDWLRERLPPAAVPRELVPVPVLPLLPSGKADRRAVAELVRAAQAAPAPTATSQSADPPSVT